MLRIVLLCSLLSACPLALAADNDSYNRVDFQVEAAREVANDLLMATMSMEIQDAQPARVAQQLNAALNGALKSAAAFTTVKAGSGNQNTHPVYGKHNQIDAWRGHGEIRLESRDFKAMSELIMKLQSTLQLGRVQFSVAPDTRAANENALIVEALKAFRARAEVIRDTLGSKAYKTVSISINNAGIPAPYPMAAMRGVAMAGEAISAPDFSGGESNITVQINGTIELQ